MPEGRGPMDDHALVRSWTHASEEDEGDRMVFRPSDSPDIQPSRMPRMAFDLGAGGALTMFGSGPDDLRFDATIAGLPVPQEALLS